MITKWAKTFFDNHQAWNLFDKKTVKLIVFIWQISVVQLAVFEIHANFLTYFKTLYSWTGNSISISTRFWWERFTDWLFIYSDFYCGVTMLISQTLCCEMIKPRYFNSKKTSCSWIAAVSTFSHSFVELNVRSGYKLASWTTTIIEKTRIVFDIWKNLFLLR